LAEDSIVLQSGDLVKIELGVHVDGYVATLAQTVVLNPHPASPVTGRAADVICAAYFGLEAAIRLCKVGGTAAEILDSINTIAASFDCRPVSGTSSHMMKRFLLESEEVGKKCFIFCNHLTMFNYH
jgi:methionine aminopeptidase